MVKSVFHELTLADGVRMAYQDRPATAADDAPVVLCLHGLTRNSQDFDPVIERLTTRYRVLAPDLRGRGRSGYDSTLERYNPYQYVNDVFALLDRLAIERVIVIGTSLGGWMAAIMASRRPSLFLGAVLNDIGPQIAPEGAARVAATAGTQPIVKTWDEAIAVARQFWGHVMPGADDATWDWYAHVIFRQTSPGVIDVNFDRRIGEAARAGLSALHDDPWVLFDALCDRPTLVLRGALSDILSADILERMHRRYRRLRSAIIPNRGHVPLLNEPEATRALLQFFGSIDPHGAPDAGLVGQRL